MELTLFGDLASKEYTKHDVFMLKDVRVSEFGGVKRLTTGFNSQVVHDISAFQQATDLFKWFQSQDINEEFLQTGNKKQKSNSLMTIEQLIESSKAIQGLEEKAYSEILGIISHVNAENNLYYLSCPTCMKKVEPSGDSYFCYKCNADTICKPRYIFNCKVQDHTGSLWISIGDETGAQVLGISAPELMKMKEQDLMENDNNRRVNEQISPMMFREYRLTLQSKL